MVIGLLGGIGAGKTTVARLLAEAGASVVDADLLAREVISTPRVKARVSEVFGQEILEKGGQVNRKALADRVFSDAGALKRLNAIIHPPVRERILEQIREHRARTRELPPSPENLLVLDVALLAESPLLEECDGLVFVEAAAAVRQERLKSRGWPRGEMERRELFQSPLDRKKKLACWTVDNSGSLEDARRDVSRVLREITSLDPAKGKD